jgi:hypothetical protein
MRNGAKNPTVIGSLAVLVAAVAAVAGAMLWLVSLVPVDQGVKAGVAVLTLPAKVYEALCTDQRVPAMNKPSGCPDVTTTGVPGKP